MHGILKIRGVDPTLMAWACSRSELKPVSFLDCEDGGGVDTLPSKGSTKHRKILQSQVSEYEIVACRLSDISWISQTANRPQARSSSEITYQPRSCFLPEMPRLKGWFN